MSDHLLNDISKASQTTKNNIAEFLNNVFSQEKKEEITHE